MTKKQYMTINIKGLDWKIFVQAPALYKRKHGADSAAITYPEDREIYFCTDRVKYGLCMHELGHALIESSGTTSANITAHQMEELILELIEEHYFDLGNWTRNVLDYVATVSRKK